MRSSLGSATKRRSSGIIRGDISRLGQFLELGRVARILSAALIDVETPAATATRGRLRVGEQQRIEQREQARMLARGEAVQRGAMQRG